MFSFAALFLVPMIGACHSDLLWEATQPRLRSPARKYESRAKSLYRHGCNCMDVLERQDCAIKYFEQLVELDDADRQIMGDTLFRLAMLYRQRGEEQQAVLLLRKFWKLGTRFQNRESLPFATRYVPSEMDVLTMVDVDRFQRSQFYRALDPLVQEYVFTCDESRRQVLESKLRKHRNQNKSKSRLQPIFSTSNCQLARAFSWSDYRQLGKFVHAMNHKKISESLAIYQIKGLDGLLAKGESTGRLEAVADHIWEIVGFSYGGQPVAIFQIDGDNLVLTRNTDMKKIRVAHQNRTRTLHSKLQALSSRVPSDATMMAVATDLAMRSGMDKLGFINNFLPNPEGLMVAVVVHRDAGVFIRLPTSEAIKSQTLVALLRYFVEGARDQDGKQPHAHMDWLENLDVSQDPSDQALILSNWISHQVIENMILDNDSQ